MRHILGAMLTGLVLSLGSTAVLARTQQDWGVEVSIRVRPVRDGAPQVRYLDVRQEIRGRIDPSTPFSLRLPTTYVGRHGVADRVDSLELRDATGVVQLRIENDPGDPRGFANLYRHWRATRAVSPPLTLTYRVRPTTYSRGPIHESYAIGGGFSSGGGHHLIVPEGVRGATLRVSWDLSDLAPGSSFVSSFAEGDFVTQGSPDTLWRSAYVAGPLGGYMPGDETGWRVLWLGKLEVDPLPFFTFGHAAYKNLRTFFRDTTTKVYRGFTIAAGGGGGNGLLRSFITTVAPDTGAVTDSTVRAHRHVLAHEIGHYFLGGLSRAPGDRVSATHWYGEGMNMYYTRLLLLRAGLWSTAEYEENLDVWVRQFYANPYHVLSNDSLNKIGFNTGFGGSGRYDALSVPYARGSLFWADLDTKIRARSGNRRNLDAVIVPLIERRLNAGTLVTQATLLDALVRELGPSVVDHFDAVIDRGELIVPPSDAFGPCFERKEVTYSAVGKEWRGYEWNRIPSIPEERCRHW